MDTLALLIGLQAVLSGTNGCWFGLSRLKVGLSRWEFAGGSNRWSEESSMEFSLWASSRDTSLRRGIDFSLMNGLIGGIGNVPTACGGWGWALRKQRG
jgi:hypothetical protein